MLMNSLDTLNKIRSKKIEAWSQGLPDEIISQFLSSDPTLSEAIGMAAKQLSDLESQYPNLSERSEKEWGALLQDGLLNFYPPQSVSPYVALAAKGPWIISLAGAVIYDTGGYGMLGLGHNPDALKAPLQDDYVMANVMTPSFYQHEFLKNIRSNIGIKRKEKNCPFDKFVCMNSGSEAMAVAARLADAHSKTLTDPGGKFEGRRIMSLSFRSSFHGRTSGPARVSDSTRKYYQAALASFRDLDNLRTIEPNNIKELRNAYDWAEKENVYFQFLFIEPVMGEGNPGMAVTREFYDEARRLTKEHSAFLVVDSIQAGLRTHGVLSIVDYPGFEDAEAPDMESYSKALNAGQFPLSVLAMSSVVADCYRPGIYGNTMTTNPRALALANAVLAALTPDLQKNIADMGNEFVLRLKELQSELPNVIEDVQGTGLLVSAALRADIPVVGFGAVEEQIRNNGINVIHGGTNSLRFTPQFAINSDEIKLIVSEVRRVLLQYA